MALLHSPCLGVANGFLPALAAVPPPISATQNDRAQHRPGAPPQRSRGEVFSITPHPFRVRISLFATCRAEEVGIPRLSVAKRVKALLREAGGFKRPRPALEGLPSDDATALEGPYLVLTPVDRDTTAFAATAFPKENEHGRASVDDLLRLDAVVNPRSPVMARGLDHLVTPYVDVREIRAWKSRTSQTTCSSSIPQNASTFWIPRRTASTFSSDIARAVSRGNDHRRVLLGSRRGPRNRRTHEIAAPATHPPSPFARSETRPATRFGQAATIRARDGESGSVRGRRCWASIG